MLCSWRVKGTCETTFFEFYNCSDDILVTIDEVLRCNDRISVPPRSRSAVLPDLHSGCLGVKKRKSLARFTCWWLELDSEQWQVAKHSNDCAQRIHSQPSKLGSLLFILWGPAACQWGQLRTLPDSTLHFDSNWSLLQMATGSFQYVTYFRFHSSCTSQDFRTWGNRTCDGYG